MRPKQVIVWKLIQEVVAKTNTAVIAELKAFDPIIEQVNFQPGTILEINDTLNHMAQGDAQYKRYPLFALLFSFNEDKYKTVGFDNEADLRILIARRALKEDKVPERYAKNFEPVLYPVYLEFLNQLYFDPRFETGLPDNIPHSKMDFPYYDTGDNADPLSDCVDAIQIKIKLKILLKNC